MAHSELSLLGWGSDSHSGPFPVVVACDTGVERIRSSRDVANGWEAVKRNASDVPFAMPIWYRLGTIGSLQSSS